MRALGVDAAGRAGWVGVVIDDDGFEAAHLEARLGDLLRTAERRGPLDAVGVDIPVGLVAGRVRAADLAMRRYVGPRRASVFAAPHPDVVHIDDHAEVNRVLAGRGLPRISVQAFHLFPRIRETAALVAAGRDLVETFPEASFTAMGGGPVLAAKKTWNGQAHRRRMLAEASPPIVVPDELGAAGQVPVDDVLDAAACAWSALRRSHGTAAAVGDPAEVDARTGRPIAVWV